jgi:hypothetical protein
MSVTISGSGQLPVQVQTTTLTTGTFTTTSTSMTNITGMAVNITPTNSSNKVLVNIAMTISGADDYTSAFQLLRNGTPVGIGTSGTTGPNYSFALTPRGSNSPTNVTWQYLDSPATTSAVTYQVQVRLQGSYPQTFALNFANTYLNAGSDVYQGCYTSTITAQEIAYA